MLVTIKSVLVNNAPIEFNNMKKEIKKSNDK